MDLLWPELRVYIVDGSIVNCYNKANISGTTTSGGFSRASGISGWISSGRIVNCYNEGNITSSGAFNRVQNGGIAGLSYGTAKIENCYNLGTISGPGEYVINNGGIVGSNGEGSNSATITNSYCTTSSAPYSYYNNMTSEQSEGRIEAEKLRT